MFTVVHCLILGTRGWGDGVEGGSEDPWGKGTCCPYWMQSVPPGLLYARNTALWEGKPKGEIEGIWGLEAPNVWSSRLFLCPQLP